MANQRKRLGTSLERTVVEQARRAGLRSRRQPLSGVLADYPNDLTVEDLLVEAKVRSVRLDAKGARILSIDVDWLEGVLKNAAKAGFKTGIVVVRMKGSARLLVLAELGFILEVLKRCQSTA